MEREGRVANRFKGLAWIVALVQVSSAFWRLGMAKNSLWQICGMDGILNITELAQERRARYADQVANVVTVMTDLIADRPSRVSREVRTAYEFKSSIRLTVDR